MKQSNFLYMPKNLIINFEYGEENKNNINIIFEEYLNLKKYILLNDSPFFYELIGIICLSNFNEEEKHFISYCKNCNNNKCDWYKYNDENVTKITYREINSIRTYSLFYSYIKA